MTKVLIITAKNCSDCVKVKALIAQAAATAKEAVEFVELDCVSEEALNKALLYDMDYVPSFVVKGTVFNTSTPNLSDIVKALTKKTV